MSWLFKPTIGLDIGHRTLKALYLKKKGKKIVLDKYFFYDLAESNAKFPQISDLDETLRGLVEVTGLKTFGVSSCVDDSETSLFDLTLPKMPKADIEGAVASEVEPRLNFPIDDASISFTIHPSSTDKKLNLKVLCKRPASVSAMGRSGHSKIARLTYPRAVLLLLSGQMVPARQRY